MVKRPIWSCDACRSRKVKCDKATPTCRICELRGVPCTWQDQLDFELQAAAAAQEVVGPPDEPYDPSPPLPTPALTEDIDSGPSSALITPSLVSVDPDYRGIAEVMGRALGLTSSQVASLQTAQQAREMIMARSMETMFASADAELPPISRERPSTLGRWVPFAQKELSLLGTPTESFMSSADAWQPPDYLPPTEYFSRGH